MTCTDCGKRPAPISGKRTTCAVCRACARNVKKALR